MKYVIELLQRELRNELQARRDAAKWLNEPQNNLKFLTHDTEIDRAAFQESQRLAMEKIPQLREAIYKLQLVEMLNETEKEIKTDGNKTDKEILNTPITSTELQYLSGIGFHP